MRSSGDNINCYTTRNYASPRELCSPHISVYFSSGAFTRDFLSFFSLENNFRNNFFSSIFTRSKSREKNCFRAMCGCCVRGANLMRLINPRNLFPRHFLFIAAGIARISSFYSHESVPSASYQAVTSSPVARLTELEFYYLAEF